LSSGTDAEENQWFKRYQQTEDLLQITKSPYQQRTVEWVVSE